MHNNSKTEISNATRIIFTCTVKNHICEWENNVVLVL